MAEVSPRLRLHPERRSLAIIAPTLLTGPALLLIGWTQPSATACLVGCGMSLYTLRGLLILQRAYTEAWPDGLVNQLAGNQAEAAWEHTTRLIVMQTLFGRYVQLEKRSGERISLAAPRTGLLLHTPDFDATLLTLSQMPGGSRTTIPIQTETVLPAVVVQSVLVVGFLSAVLVAVLT
ncbi:hypothetical protein [Actinomadura hibisca]|uniref:hypothetical protein n=1 Tax=Actinomadura hibisca TaxID=68565 RepID=UPI0008337B93|nr:hypothetical protein [Actinomadura hibisca]